MSTHKVEQLVIATVAVDGTPTNIFVRGGLPGSRRSGRLRQLSPLAERQNLAPHAQDHLAHLLARVGHFPQLSASSSIESMFVRVTIGVSQLDAVIPHAGLAEPVLGGRRPTVRVANALSYPHPTSALCPPRQNDGTTNAPEHVKMDRSRMERGRIPF
jgi:hypothetical protein